MSPKETEFSRLITLSRIPPKGTEERLEASDAERKALAKRFNLMDLSVLRARVALRPSEDHTFVAEGTIEAEVVQCCVATLEPLTNRLCLHVCVVFIPESSRSVAEALSSDELENEYEFYRNGKIDLGEMVAQQLGVNIDPYPRKEGTPLVEAEFGAKNAALNPFARLSDAAQNIKKAKQNKGKKKS